MTRILHLHFLEELDEANGRFGPMLAMTTYWKEAGKDPKICTFRQIPQIAGNRVSHRSGVTPDNKGLRGLCVLLLEAFAQKNRWYELTGELQTALREVHDENEGKKGKPTWLQDIFDLPVGTYPREAGILNAAPGQLLIGETLRTLDLKVFIHRDVAALIPHGKPILQGQLPPPVDVAEYGTIANALFSEVKLSCLVEIQKRGASIWQDASAGRGAVLPLGQGDRFRLRISCKPKAALYVALLDSKGGVSPIFPWLPTMADDPFWGDGDARSRTTSRSTLALPEIYARELPEGQRNFEISIDIGADTILIVASRENLGTDYLSASEVRDMMSRLATTSGEIIECEVDGLDVRTVWPPQGPAIPTRSFTLAADRPPPLLTSRLGQLRELIKGTNARVRRGAFIDTCLAVTLPLRQRVGRPE